MKHIAAVILIGLALTGCKEPKSPAAISEACEVIYRTLYYNGRFKFSDAEINAMSEENQKKIDSVKRFFRHCPQYARLKAARK